MNAPVQTVAGRVRRLALPLLCLLAVGCEADSRSPERGLAADDPSPAAGDPATDARAVHDALLTLDSHAGFSTDPLESCGETDRQVDFPRMRRGGLDAVFFTVYAEQRERTPERYAEARRRALEVFERLHDLVERCSADVALARTPNDLVRIVETGRLAIAIGIENGFVIGPDLDLLERFAELGAAYVGLTHDGHNAIADAAIPRDELGDPPSEHGGVSAFGERVIAELNRLGIMVDVS
ncbi:MAG: membrane dipeptidase, partial [Gemmatimonadota bacterium]|nr:membrane dipeptidase [Gemmatimonadota bacterium]